MRKNYKYSLLALLAVMGMASCSDNDFKYEGAEAVTNEQVFFSDKTIATTSYELDLTATSFDIEIQRAKTDGELTVALENHQNPNSTLQLSVPSSVTFADGASTATISVGYQYVEGVVEFDDVNRDTIIIASNGATTPYGGAEYRFAVSIPEPWTTWVATSAAFAAQGGLGDFPLGSEGDGTGDYTYSDAFFGVGDDPGLPVLFRQNKLNPTQGEFLIQHWGYNVDLVMKADWDADLNLWRLYVPTTYIGYDHASYGPVNVGDWMAYYEYTDREPPSWEALYNIDQASYYDPVAGLFTLYLHYYVEAGRFGADYEYFQVHGFYVPDYSVVPTFQGILTKDDVPYAQIWVDFGVDVQKALAYVVEKNADAGAVADALAAGDVEGIELVAGINNIPVGDLTGELQVVVASIVDGEVGSSDAVKFAYYGGGQKAPWKSLGEGFFTDDAILPLFGYDADDYPVEIEESTETPGVYRLLAMYSAVAADFGVESGTGDVIVNAEDADYVYILPQPLELTIGSYGPFSITTDAGVLVERYGFDAVKAQMPEVFAKLKDGVITFPILEEESNSGDMVSYQLWLILNGNYYFAGRAGQYKIVLPSASAAVKAEAASARRAKSFRNRLYGTKVNRFDQSGAKKLRMSPKKVVSGKASIKPLK